MTYDVIVSKEKGKAQEYIDQNKLASDFDSGNKVLIMNMPEVLEGLDVVECRFHFLTDDYELVRSARNQAISRGRILKNYTVKRFDPLD